jgi:hypothetical protein
VEEAGGSVLDAQGELITTQYFDSLAAEVNELLQVRVSMRAVPTAVPLPCAHTLPSAPQHGPPNRRALLACHTARENARRSSRLLSTLSQCPDERLSCAAAGVGRAEPC